MTEKVWMLVMTGFRNICRSTVSRVCSFLKFADGQTQRFRMFPYIEKREGSISTVRQMTWVRS